MVTAFVLVVVSRPGLAALVAAVVVFRILPRLAVVVAAVVVALC